MKIPYTNIEIGKIKDVNIKQPKSIDIIEKIVYQQIIRQQKDIKNWRSAIIEAESSTNPNRKNLMTIYNDVTLDSHLTSLISTRINKLLSCKFYIYNLDDTINEEITYNFEELWFEKFVQYAIESIFYGYSLVQFSDIVDNKFSDVELIPREYVVPETNIVKKHINSMANDGINYIQNPYDKWCLFLSNNKKNLGLLNKACPMAIWKKNVLGSWSEFAELFGMPIRVGRTNIKDPSRKKNMDAMLKSIGSAASATLDMEDKIEFVSTNSSDAFRVYDELISRCNSEMSKLILGQTMTSDDGSSRSQAEVHERILENYITADKKFITNIVNNQLIPLMKKQRMINNNVYFWWDYEENLSVMQKVNIIKELSPYYQIDPEAIEQMIGIKVEPKTFNINEATSVMPDVMNFYAELDK